MAKLLSKGMAGLEEAVRYHAQLGTTGTEEKAEETESLFFCCDIKTNLSSWSNVV